MSVICSGRGAGAASARRGGGKVMGGERRGTSAIGCALCTLGPPPLPPLHPAV